MLKINDLNCYQFLHFTFRKQNNNEYKYSKKYRANSFM